MLTWLKTYRQYLLAGFVILAATLSTTTAFRPTDLSKNLSNHPSPSGLLENEIIVKFKDEASSVRARTLGLTVAAANLSVQKKLSGQSVLFKLESVTPPTQPVQEVLNALRSRSDVEYAHSNYRFQPSSLPNDPLVGKQWHLNQLQLPKAWAVTAGSNSVVIAVLDNGKVNHPDLNNKWLGGYDFIDLYSDDGDGHDSDPTNPKPELSAHGAHVASIVAATTNDKYGSAGNCPNCYIQPIRVGIESPDGLLVGFSIPEIADGIRWAAGLPVPELGLAQNPYPAQVINMSFEVKGIPCGGANYLQDAIDAAYAKGVSIVVAAGNGGKDPKDTLPASCKNVISVAATTPDFAKAAYSNFGSSIAVVAPGGGDKPGWGSLVDCYASIDLSTDPSPGTAGILAAWMDSRGIPCHRYLSGTSLAAPNVAGIIGLMLSQNRHLTPSQVLERLKTTATPLTANQCTKVTNPNTNQLVSGCGAGLVNAYAALGGPSVRDDVKKKIRWHYLDLLNREPDLGGWDYWTNWQLDACGPDENCHFSRWVEIANAFMVAAEYTQSKPDLAPSARGTSAYNAAFVRYAYRSFLRREADTAGLNYYWGELNRSNNYSAFVSALLSSSEYTNLTR
jgi:hypothetical protein